MDPTRPRADAPTEPIPTVDALARALAHATPRCRSDGDCCGTDLCHLGSICLPCQPAGENCSFVSCCAGLTCQISAEGRETCVA